MTQRSVADDQMLGQLARRQHTLFQRVRDGKLPAEQVLGELQRLLEGNFAPPAATAVSPPRRYKAINGLWSPVEQQLERVHAWNARRSWGLTDADFAAAAECAPKKWPDGKLTTIVLVPYLQDQGIILRGVHRTFHELWRIAASRQHANWRWGGYNHATDNRLRLLEGIAYKPGLRWEVIDLGANHGQKSIDVRNLETSPHLGVLAAAALHPKWVRSMDGNDIPYVLLPGFKVNILDDDSWSDVPDLCFDRVARKLTLNYGLCNVPDSYWSVPLLREC